MDNLFIIKQDVLNNTNLNYILVVNYNKFISHYILNKHESELIQKSFQSKDNIIYNPFNLNYWIKTHLNNNYIKFDFNLFKLFNNYNRYYDYIISKRFYNVLKYIIRNDLNKLQSNQNNKQLCIMIKCWININPYFKYFLINSLDNINFQFLSLNPKCFSIYSELYKKFKFDKTNTNNQLDTDFLSANPCIFTYNYNTIKQHYQKLHDELISELYHPQRIEKYLIKYNYNLESLDDYLN